MAASPLILRRGGRAMTAMPRILRSGPAKRNGTDNAGIRSVTFAPPECIPMGEADINDLTPVNHSTMGFDDLIDGTHSATLTPIHRCAGVYSTPLSGYRVHAEAATYSTPLSEFRAPLTPRVVKVATSFGESPQFSGAQSMPMTNFLRRASECEQRFKANVAAADDVGMNSTSGPLDEQYRGITTSVPLSDFRPLRLKSATQVDATMTSAASGKEKQRRRCKTVNLGTHLSPELKVVVVAPGGGTGMNAGVYSKLSHKDDISLQIVGQSRAPYDRYTEAWGAPTGGPAPNLESFAMELSSQGVLENCDCLVVGSRGGQVCLPTFWRMKGADVPPTVVLNGGCAMQLPIDVPWPDSAVTFLLLGGQDYFRQQFTMEQYLSDAQIRVPHDNCTTAILLVQEMAHMPQAQLLDAILHSMMKAVTSWKEDSDTVPMEEFQGIVAAVSAIGLHAKLIYKTGPGDAWDVTKVPDMASGSKSGLRHAHTYNGTVMHRAAPIHRD